MEEVGLTIDQQKAVALMKMRRRRLEQQPSGSDTPAQAPTKPPLKGYDNSDEFMSGFSLLGEKLTGLLSNTAEGLLTLPAKLGVDPTARTHAAKYGRPDPTDPVGTVGHIAGSIAKSPYTVPKAAAGAVSGILGGDPVAAAQGTTDFIAEAPNLLGLTGGIKAAKKFVEQRPIRLGRTTPDPVTGKPVPPPNAIQVPLGQRIPREMPDGTPLPKEKPIRFDNKSVEQAAEALHPKAPAMEGRALAEDFNVAFRDLKLAQQTAVREPMQVGGMNASLERAANWSRDRIWREGIAPLLKDNPHVATYTNAVPDIVVSRLKGLVPDEELAGIAAKLRKKYDGVHSIAQQQDWLKTLNAENRANQIANNFEKATAENTTAGRRITAENDAVRHAFYKSVQDAHGIDVRPLMDRYGASSSIAELAGMFARKPNLIERFLDMGHSAYLRGEAIKAGQALGREVLSENRKLARAFDAYGQLTPEDIAALQFEKVGKFKGPVTASTVQGGAQPPRSFIEAEPGMVAPAPTPHIQTPWVRGLSPRAKVEAGPQGSTLGPNAEPGLVVTAPVPPPGGQGPRHTGLGQYSSIQGSPQPPRGSIGGPDRAGSVAPEPTPGPTAIIRDWTKQTPKGEATWPQPTKPGVQQNLVSPAALPPEDFHIGQTGVVQPFFVKHKVTGQVREMTPSAYENLRPEFKQDWAVVAPEIIQRPKMATTPEGVRYPLNEWESEELLARDYTKQQQLFSVSQTPPPRWQPSMLHADGGYTTASLKALRNEIVNYIQTGKLSVQDAMDYAADVLAMDAEILARTQSRATPPAAPPPSRKP